MNPFLFSIILFCFFIGKPILEFPAGRTHDFGEVVINTKVTHRFSLKNTGDAPLKILNVSTTCECTVAEYSKLIAPGETGFVEVVYSAGGTPEAFKKYIMVMTNTEEQVEKLSIFGRVVKVKSGK